MAALGEQAMCMSPMHTYPCTAPLIGTTGATSVPIGNLLLPISQYVYAVYTACHLRREDAFSVLPPHCLPMTMAIIVKHDINDAVSP
eukprot:scaffold44179_cov38-Prasinocladus_malaysianus.AAC.1